jgi:PHD/YefM family antitoxin component YafN of YafNO toxin-antitoxin module
VDDFDAAQETIDWLTDPDTRSAVKEADAEIADGATGASVADMREELGLDL